MIEVEELIARIRECAPDATLDAELEEAKSALLELALGPVGGKVRDHIEQALKGELLEVRWELEEVLEDSAPAPPEAPARPPEPEPEPDDDDELVMVYDDPRGLVLHRSRDGSRWFATQLDPATGQPQSFELPPHQIAAVQQQLAGSPYWVLGTGS
jgi:hypothetical protein